MKCLHDKTINNRHCLSTFYYCNPFTQKRHGMLIISIVVPKIFCLSHINSWLNILDPVRKRLTVTRMKVHNNKAICLDVGRNHLDICIDYHGEVQLSYLAMNLMMRHIRDMPCMILVLSRLEYIICLIKSACTHLFLPNLDPFF